MNPIFVSLLFLILMKSATSDSTSTIECEQNLHCNKKENASCCLISRSTVIQEHNLQIYDSDRDTIQRILFEPNQNVFFLPVLIFYEFPSVVVYIAKNCRILKIGSNNFKGLRKLKTLDFSWNLITSLKNEIFNELVSLERISLSMTFTHKEYADKNPVQSI